jgi:hypothetical protein
MVERKRIAGVGSVTVVMLRNGPVRSRLGSGDTSCR